jgi:hypothetical protein
MVALASQIRDPANLNNLLDIGWFDELYPYRMLVAGVFL